MAVAPIQLSHLRLSLVCATVGAIRLPNWRSEQELNPRIMMLQIIAFNTWLSDQKLEVGMGIEPTIAVLQTAALPLGHPTY